MAALTASCSASPAPLSAPLEVVDAVFDVVGSPSDPVPLAPIDDKPWIDIRSMTIMRTEVDLEVSLELVGAPDPTGFMTYSIEFDTSGDGMSDYSLWAEYFGDGTARPGLVPWAEGEALFDEAFPGSLTVDDRVLTWIVPLASIPGESLRVAAVAQSSGDAEMAEAVLVAQDHVPDAQLNEATREEVWSWITVP